MKKFQHISRNTIAHLSLHDCQCTRFYHDNGTLVFEMEWMEVLSTHPDNPYDKAHQSGAGQIILCAPELRTGTLHGRRGHEDQTITPESADIRDFEILDFDEEPDGAGYLLNVFGVFDGNPKFDNVEMSIRYASSAVLFDTLEGESWFEDEAFRENDT